MDPSPASCSFIFFCFFFDCIYLFLYPCNTEYSETRRNNFCARGMSDRATVLFVLVLLAALLVIMRRNIVSENYTTAQCERTLQSRVPAKQALGRGWLFRTRVWKPLLNRWACPSGWRETGCEWANTANAPNGYGFRADPRAGEKQCMRLETAAEVAKKKARRAAQPLPVTQPSDGWTGPSEMSQ